MEYVAVSIFIIFWVDCIRRGSRLKNDGSETIRYTVEREFLAKITVAEFVSRIIQSHVKDQTEKEIVSS